MYVENWRKEHKLPISDLLRIYRCALKIFIFMIFINNSTYTEYFSDFCFYATAAEGQEKSTSIFNKYLFIFI